MVEPQPLEDIVVNDRYWLGWARRRIDEAQSSRSTAIEKLVSAVGWFWTVYTALALAGVALASRRLSFGKSVVVFVPVVILTAAYLFGTFSLVPPTAKVDPVSPTDIEETYNRTLAWRKKRLRILAILVGTGAASVVVAGAMVAFASPPTTPSFEAAVVRETDGASVYVTGHFDDDERVLVAVTAVDDKSAAEVRRLFQASGNGTLSGSISSVLKSREYRVSATWSSDDIEMKETRVLR